MKRANVVPVYWLLLAMGLAFVALASPVAAASPGLAQTCATGSGAESAWPALLAIAALAGATVGLMSLRRQVLRLGGFATSFSPHH
jgi:hypothetical protein